ncbi:hypothetical protein HY990_07230 [Candidatus Micrarchaeota archaeon]|nr:hypothetical protein [Candidatus Micrarchaeota archaeon]
MHLRQNNFITTPLSELRKEKPEEFGQLIKLCGELNPKQFPEATIVREDKEYATIGDVYRLSRKLAQKKKPKEQTRISDLMARFRSGSRLAKK